MKVSKEEFDYISRMITSCRENDQLELEAAFYNPSFMESRRTSFGVTSNEYLRVKQMLVSSGFEYLGNDKMLRVFYPSKKNIRVTIEGEEAIEFFCTKNLLPMGQFVIEEKLSATEVGSRVMIEDLNCRINLKQENILSEEDARYKEIIKNNSREGKYFRLIERLSFTTKDGIFRFDISCVRSNIGRRPAIQFSRSGVSSSQRNYEIELEMIDKRRDTREIVRSLYKHITMYHTVISEFKGIMRKQQQDVILNDYLTLVNASIMNGWVGPKPVSLEHINMMENDNIPNITNDYCITDKADGLRCLIYVSPNGKCYAITMNMQVFDIKVDCNKPNTVIDCEYVFEDKSGNRIEMFGLFDIYYLEGESVMANPFIAPKNSPSRLAFMNQLRFTPLKNSTIVKTKKYYPTNQKKTIWKATKEILDAITDGVYPYHTDGIIYQPMSLVVGGTTKNNQVPANTGRTWSSVFKWKPSTENTIDFLVRYDKRKIKRALNPMSNNVEYLVPGLLLITSNEQDKCDLMYRERFNERSKIREELFKPMKPALDDSYKLNMFMTKRGDLPKTTLGEPIEDQMIVECTYDFSKPQGYRWIPMRIRHDKTQQYRGKNRRLAMNFITTANSIWTLIHNPITPEMIKTGNFGDDENMRDVENIQNAAYYNRVGRRSESRMLTLQRFHNIVIKSESMIQKYVSTGAQLLDLACGKGGDMGKWSDSGVSFVLGIDINEDNIRGASDSVCARYVVRKQRNPETPNMVFMQTDSQNPINIPASYDNRLDKMICRSVYDGVETVPEAAEYSLLQKVSGLATQGFDVVEIMFAIHYLMKTPDSFEGLMKNVVDNIKPGGIFMFNSLNGKKVKQLLQNTEKGTMYKKELDGKMMWGITKKYDDNDEETNNFGNAIDVYVESINAVFEEYLVDYQFLESELTSRGFEKVEIVDFEVVHKRNGNQEKYPMTPEERAYSYLHSFAIFRKVD